MPLNVKTFISSWLTIFLEFILATYVDILLYTFTEGSSFKEDSQMRLSTFKTLEDSVTKDCDTGFKEKEPIKDMHNADVEEKKSITEEDNAAAIVAVTNPVYLLHNKK